MKHDTLKNYKIKPITAKIALKKGKRRKLGPEMREAFLNYMES